MHTTEKPVDRPVVIITGGGTGIGSGIARRLAETHNVVVCGRRPEPLDRVTTVTGGLSFVGDVSDPSDVLSMECARMPTGA